MKKIFLLVIGLCLGALGCGADGDDAAAAGSAGMSQAGSAGSAVAGAPGTGGVAGSGGGGGTGAVSGPGDLFIQEDELGFSAVDGLVVPRQGSTSVTGYTGTGYADSDTGLGKTMAWSVNAENAGSYQIVFRYAFGGDATNLRDAQLLVNGDVSVPMLSFPYTTDWSNWQVLPPISVDFAAGSNFIQLVALDPGGLANIDYIEILGDGITPSTPKFTFSLSQNDANAGSVSYDPVQPFYEAGATITLTASANSGYFFQSWSGGATGTSSPFTFQIQQNTSVTGLFLPDGTTQDPALVGYAGVQDDSGTPYIVTGGSLGMSVTAASVADLKMYLGGADPYVVSFSGLFSGPDLIDVGSNKTLLGVGSDAHLDGIELRFNGSENVIVRNVTVSNVIADGSGIANDAMEITGGAAHIWLDHCQLYSDLDHGKDYYDGLLDIKNKASFITVSWCEIHHHYKASLISSGVEQVGDTVIRATYHHNYFHDCGSRLPSIRFGRAHVFDNFYDNNATGSCVDSRMGALVKAESNYFRTSKNTIGWFEDPVSGKWDVSNNVYDMCTGAQPTTSTGTMTPGYPYTLDDPQGLPSAIPAGAGVGKL